MRRRPRKQCVTQLGFDCEGKWEAEREARVGERTGEDEGSRSAGDGRARATAARSRIEPSLSARLATALSACARSVSSGVGPWACAVDAGVAGGRVTSGT